MHNAHRQSMTPNSCARTHSGQPSSAAESTRIALCTRAHAHSQVGLTGTAKSTGLCRAAVVVQVCSGLKCDGIMCGQNSDVGVENGKLNWECVRCSCNPRPFGRTCTRTMPTHTHALVQYRKRLPHVCSGKCIKTCESTLINDCGTCKGGNCHCAKGELR
jgi:hypothetical protein